MMLLTTGLASACAAYVVFTLSSTGWVKLATLRGTAHGLGRLWPRLPHRTVVFAALCLGVGEVALAGAAALVPTGRLIAWASAGLFTAFAVYNAAAARRSPRSNEPCLCAGAGSAAPEGSAYARSTANLVMAMAALIWGVGAATIPGWFKLVLLGIWALPLTVWAIRRSSVMLGDAVAGLH